jgi:hypothetical protein
VRTEEAGALLWAEVGLVAGTVVVYRSGMGWQDHGLVFCRADGTPLDRWQVRREFVEITRAAGLGGGLDPADQLIGHGSTSVTGIVYRHEIGPALIKGATAMDKILRKKNKTA